MIMMYTKTDIFRLSLKVLTSLMFLLLVPLSVNAAELFLSPPSGQFEVGETFSISVMLDPGQYSVNAAEGEIEFPDGIEIEGISTVGSAFNMWTEEPSVVRGTNKIFFSGGVSSPVSGSTAVLLNIDLRSSLEGIQRIRVPSGAIMSADGTGNNVISALQSAVYTFLIPPEERDPEPEYLAPEGAPEAISIRSSTHLEIGRWYSEKDVILEWDLPGGIDMIRAEINQRPTAIPREIERGPVETLSFEDVPDGVWYFHLQVRNEFGWSEVSTREVRIDTNQPERFELRLLDRDDETDPFFRMETDALDLVSGIDRLDFIIEGVYEESFPAGTETVEIGPIPPGVHNLIARAYNQAGIHRTSSLVLEVSPIESPVFTETPDIIHSGSIMAFRGESISGSRVIISLERVGHDADEYEVRVDVDGRFVFIAPNRPTDGVYKVRAKAVDDRGAESLYSSEFTVAVQPPSFLRLGAMMVDSLSVLVSLLAILFMAIFSVYWAVHKWRVFKRRLDKEIREAEEEVHQTFENLRKRALYQLSLLQSAENERKLTEEEMVIKEQLQKDVTDIGVSAEKEVHDIKEAFDK